MDENRRKWEAQQGRMEEVRRQHQPPFPANPIILGVNSHPIASSNSTNVLANLPPPPPYHSLDHQHQSPNNEHPAQFLSNVGINGVVSTAAREDDYWAKLNYCRAVFTILALCIFITILIFIFASKMV